MQSQESTQVPGGSATPPLREGQMWRGTYAPKYHILGLYESFAWVLVHYTGVSASRQPQAPETFPRDFFGQKSMRCIYDPSEVA